MRIALDFDGTITEGRYLEPPRTPAMYLGLKPYDQDTLNVLYDLCNEHEVYIITARSEPYAYRGIKAWFQKYWGSSTIKPVGILTNIQQPDKYELALQLKCDVMFDDSPTVWHMANLFNENEFIQGPVFYLMDNPQWDKNQLVPTNYGKSYDPYNWKCRIYSWKELNNIIQNEAFNNRKLYTSQTSL